MLVRTRKVDRLPSDAGSSGKSRVHPLTPGLHTAGTYTLFMALMSTGYLAQVSRPHAEKLIDRHKGAT